LLGVAQAVRSIDLTRFNIQANARTRDQIAINPVLDRPKLRINPTKLLAVPQVYASLVLDLNIHPEVLEQRLSGKDYLILSLPRQIVIKVKNVVVLYSPCGGALRLMIPDSLE
jgi:hypothetical protein